MRTAERKSFVGEPVASRVTDESLFAAATQRWNRNGPGRREPDQDPIKPKRSTCCP